MGNFNKRKWTQRLTPATDRCASSPVRRQPRTHASGHADWDRKRLHIQRLRSALWDQTADKSASVACGRS
ncbi:hypothetical protein BaRGS_00016437, partial [Batillaria attramentaria]